MASYDPLQGFREDTRRTWERRKTTRRILGFALQAIFLGIVWLLAPFLPPTPHLIVLAGLMALFGLSGPWFIWLLSEEFRRADVGAFGWRTVLSASLALLLSGALLFMAAAYALPLWSR